jgi:hypothetical protein
MTATTIPPFMPIPIVFEIDERGSIVRVHYLDGEPALRRTAED